MLNKRNFLINIIILLFSIFLIFTKSLLTVVGLISAIISIIVLVKQLVEFINKKEKKQKIIIYSILSFIFGLIFLSLFVINIIEVAKTFNEQATFTSYATGIIKDINEDIVNISCNINDNEKIIKVSALNAEFLNIGDSTTVYFNPNNLSGTIISPMIMKMMYLFVFVLINLPLGSLAYTFGYNLYRTIKPKKIKEEEVIKIKR